MSSAIPEAGARLMIRHALFGDGDVEPLLTLSGAKHFACEAFSCSLGQLADDRAQHESALCIMARDYNSVF